MPPLEPFYAFITTAPNRTPQSTDLVPLVANNTTYNATVAQLLTGATGLPKVVATQAFANQTSGLPATTIYTPTAAGIFRISLVTSSSPVGSSGETAAPAVNWTDPTGGAGSFDFETIPLSGIETPSTNTPLDIWVGANQNIQLGVPAPAIPIGASYSVTIVIEQLA
jgi:hypothetical protein